ncbi:hypothetical protein WR25_18806 [Diploscapter pachys]|uniref:C-type lectin domain-containing protein n=1 Tax=Diploscapter pachys TaxID=2018661 RepID=A0A2A2J8W1_9BILA|nr:hypothetical protein WR25_18806 [Diploscapter pachys]
MARKISPRLETELPVTSSYLNKMRPVILLLWGFFISGFANQQYSHQNDVTTNPMATIKAILKTWNPSKPIKFVPDHVAMEYEHQEAIYHRRKREAGFEEPANAIPHVRAALPTSRACQIPGYTGEYCEFPICPEQNMYIPDDPANSADGASIDAAVLLNCSQSYVTMVDNTMYWITYEIESDPPLNPTFYVMGEDGTVYSPDQIERTASYYRGFFNSLDPGQYTIVPTADLPQSICILTQKARTDMTFVGGFVSGQNAERNDFPIKDYTYFETNSIVTVHANRLRIPGDLRAISIHGGDNFLIRPKLLRPRYNCSYEYIYESFWCPNDRGGSTQSYYLQVEGTTHMGYHFRRIQPFRCVLPPVTSPTPTQPPTPSPTPVSSCDNDGILINPLEGDPYCYCIGLYGGPTCSTPLCQNNGWLPNPATDTRCQCPDGFSGIHCQNVYCSDNAGNEFNAENPSFILVIRTRSQLSDVIGQVLNSTDALMNFMNFAPTYIADYILVLFNNDKLLVNERYDKYGDMQTRLTQAMHSEPSDGGCTDSVFGAIASALSQYPNNKSPLYVFTDGGPDDSAMMNDVLHLQSYWRSPIHLFVVQPNLADGCSINPEDPGYRDMLSVSEKASGTVYWFPQQNRARIGEFYLQHALHTFYRSQLMLSNDVRVCSNQALYKPISVDADIDRMVITATGTNLTLMITDPMANRVNFDLVYNDGTNYIWQKHGVIIGQWFITLMSSTPQSSCSFKVYQKNFDNAISAIPDFDMFFTYTEAIMSDGFQMQPIYGWNAAPVFHVNNIAAFAMDTSTIFANLQIYASRNGNQTEVYASNGMFRDACSFHFYFNAFTCQVPEETLYFNLFVRDRLGFTLQRAGTMFCSRINVTPPPSHICQNGGVMNPSNNTCFCYPGYTGTYCQNIQCYNGGTPQGTQCACVPSWTGQFCEIPRCIQKGFNPADLRYGVDMVFAVELTANGLASLAMLDKNIEEVIRDVVFQDFRWIRQFVLVGFNSTWGGVLATAPASNPSAVISTLHNLTQSVPTDNGCLVQLWRALDAAVFQRDTPPGSFLEVFQTTPENDNDTFNLGAFYEWTRTGQLTVYGFLSALPSWQPNGLACNATFDQFNTLFGVAASARGMTYVMQPGEIQYATRAIPLQFSNGLVYGQQQDDCTGTPLYAYFPVDAYAQTLIVNAWGANMEVHLYTGAGDEWPYDTVWSDNWLDYKMIEARRPCDENWDQVGQYCIKFVSGTDTLNWTDAQAYCRSAGGFLVDDLTSDKNTYLYNAAFKNQFWLGLFNNGSGWMWDRGATQPANLDQDQQFWKGGGGPPPYDANNPCVYFDGAAGNSGQVWTPDACSTQRNFVCQKHRYDQDYHPFSLDADLLPPGYWYVTVKTSPNSTSSGDWTGCAVSVRVQSSLQIVTGFVTDISSDELLPDPVQDSVVNRISTFVYSEEHEAKVPIMTDAILVDAYNLTFYNGLKYQMRLSCNKPWITQTFACPNGDNPGNEFAVAHKGEDERGYPFSRITFGHCSPEELSCGNGGVRWNGTCVCDDFWTGSFCTVPICVNGGTRDPTDRFCNCPAGYTGRNCEFAFCTPRQPDTYTFDNKTLLFIVETTNNNKAAAQSLADNIPAIIGNATANNPYWFQNYALVTFDSTGVKSQNFALTDANSLQSALNTQIGQISDNGNCNMALFGVLQAALSAQNNIAYPSSEVIMVTMAGVSDANNRIPSTQEVSSSRAKLHYVYINGTCGQAPSNDSMNYLARLAYGSSGNVLVVIPENVGPLFTSYVPTLYGASTLTHPTAHLGFTCGAGVWYVEVDRNTTQIYATSSSEYGSLTAVDPLNQMLVPNVLFNDGNQKVYSVDVNSVPGIYKFSLSSPGYCFAHIYSVGGAKIYPKFAQVTADDPTGTHIDGTFTNPYSNVSTVINIHMMGRLFTRGYLQYVDIFDPDTLTLILRSELYERFDCAYQFYSDPFMCNSEMLGIFIYGVDEYNQQFRRQEIAYCLNNQPPMSTLSPPPPQSSSNTPPQGQTTQTPNPGQTTQTPNPGQTTQTPIPGQTTQTPPQGQTSATPPPQTSPGTAPPASTTFGPNSMAVDVVFVVDMGQEANQTYQDFSQFMKTVTIPWNIDASGARTRVALVAVYTDIAINTNSLNSMGSRGVFLGALDTFFREWTDTQPGQNLTAGLTLISSDDYLAPSNGYRKDIKNHVIVYLTATDNINGDPTAIAQNIRSTNLYGILVVGYGSGVSNQAVLKVWPGL